MIPIVNEIDTVVTDEIRFGDNDTLAALVANLIDEETLASRREAILEALQWEGPVYEISAISGRETDRLSGDLMTAIEYLNEQEAEDEELQLHEQDVQMRMQSEARERIESLRLERKAARLAAQRDDDDNADDGDVEVEYRT